MFLLDTSTLTRLRAPSVLRRIEELDAAGLARTSMTDLEIGFSARNAEEWDRLVVALGAFRRIDVEAHHFDRAQQVQRQLAADGLKGRKVPDLLTAAVAESGGRRAKASRWRHHRSRPIPHRVHSIDDEALRGAVDVVATMVSA